VAHQIDPSERDTQDLEKSDESTTDDLKKPAPETGDINTREPVRKRIDSSQWITSW